MVSPWPPNPGRVHTARLLLVAALTAVSVSAHAQELGRLFFTAQERQALDDKRKAGVNKNAAATQTAATALPAESVPVPEAESVIVPEPVITGFVVRSSGKNTVWVNQQPAYSDNLPSIGPRLSRLGAATQDKR
jgi:hypothetical protein